MAFANPHGSTGYGQDFTAEISGDWAGAVFEDLMKVPDALAKLPYVDAERMGAMGWSFGGYMMDWLEGHTDHFKAIVTIMGAFDLRSMSGATEELWFPEWELKGQPGNSAQYEKFSPSYYVKQLKTPCLVISGERDYRIPYTQSLQMFTSLQKMNVPSRLIIYANAGHWPSWYEMAIYYTAHLEWFHQYLGGESAPWTTGQLLRNAAFEPGKASEATHQSGLFMRAITAERVKIVLRSSHCGRAAANLCHGHPDQNHRDRFWPRPSTGKMPVAQSLRAPRSIATF